MSKNRQSRNSSRNGDALTKSELQQLTGTDYSTVQRLIESGLQFTNGKRIADKYEQLCSETAFRSALAKFREQTQSDRLNLDGRWFVSSKLAFELLGWNEYSAKGRQSRDGKQHMHRDLQSLHRWSENGCLALGGEKLGRDKVRRRWFFDEEHILEISRLEHAGEYIVHRGRRYCSPRRACILKGWKLSRNDAATNKLKRWSKRGCPHLDGQKLRAVRKGRRWFFDEEQLQLIDDGTRGRPFKFHPDYDGIFPQPNGDRAITLDKAIEERPRFTRSFLDAQISRGQYHPNGRLPSQKRRPPTVWGRSPLRVTILESDLDLLAAGIDKANRDGNPHGWPDSRGIAELLGCDTVNQRLAIGICLSAARDAGKLTWMKPSLPTPVRGGKRARPHLYEPVEAISFLRQHPPCDGIDAIENTSELIHALGDEVAGDTDKRPCFDRDHLWLTWYEAEGEATHRSFAKIVREWNNLPQREREENCPADPNSIPDNKSGQNRVKTAIYKAKGERE